jgi:hypothetical protein
MSKVKIIILRGVSLGGGVDAFPGDVVEVDAFFAKQLLTRGSADLVVDPPPRIQHQEPEIENREDEPAPSRKGGRRAR